MMKFRQISVCDAVAPISDNWIGTIGATPEDLASKLRTEADSSFDDLDRFSFLGIEAGGQRIGFRRYRGDKKNWSVITVSADSTVRVDDAHRICLELFGAGHAGSIVPNHASPTAQTSQATMIKRLADAADASERALDASFETSPYSLVGRS